MDRREMIGMMGAGVGAVGLAAFSGGEARAQEPSSKLDTIHKECLEACSHCSMACEMAFHHCSMQVAEGKRDHAKPLRYTIDCAGFCSLSAGNIARQSPLMAFSCEACAGVCKETLAVVSKFDSDEMKVAAKALTRCEKACTAMVEAMDHHHH